MVKWHFPSAVCGEDCSIQTCPLCAPDKIKQSVVDLVMYRTLEDVAFERGTLDELLITIPKCRHVFTVETLDGHCGINEYYRREEPDGRWLGLEASPSDFKKPPVCPTCRSAITTPRYGRIFKRADLDILERNVASQMSQSLGKVHNSIESWSKTEMEAMLTTEASTIKAVFDPCSEKSWKKRSKARAAVLKEKRELPAAVAALDPGNTSFYAISPAVVKAWKKATQQMLQTYKQAYSISTTRSAHLSAWQSALSCLYQQEMDFATSNPTRAPRRPSEHAMRMAKKNVGQPQPRADKRFLVEAFWVTIRVRFTLADLAQTWLKAVSSRGESYPAAQRQMWAIYGSFLLETCLQDAQIAFDIAQESESRRQMTKTSLLIMRAELERFRFNAEMSRQSGAIKDDRQNLIDSASQKIKDAGNYMTLTLKSHRDVRRPRPEEEEIWLDDNFTRTASTIIDEWGSIERSLRSNTFYEPVSLEEQMAIVRAFNFCKSIRGK